jgi:NADH:ubiquinone oxidoreductase subunit 6 (subunit J)
MLNFFLEISFNFYKKFIIIYYNLQNYIYYNYMTGSFMKGSWDIALSNYIYIFFFSIIIISSLGVILSKNPIHSVFFLILVFLNVGFFLLMLHVEFLAFLLFIVYLGAIAVLFLFVVMMFNIHILDSRDNILRYIPLVFLIFIIILEMSYITDIISLTKDIFLFTELQYIHKNWYSLIFSKENMIVLSILYNYYLYHFIIASLILLVAMIGAIILTLNQFLKLKKQIYYKQNRKNVYNSLVLKTNNKDKRDSWELYMSDLKKK